MLMIVSMMNLSSPIKDGLRRSALRKPLTASAFDRMNMVADRSKICQRINPRKTYRAVAMQTPKSMPAVEVKDKDCRPRDDRNK